MTASRHFAFIRAINTGGRRLTNEQVVDPFRRLGLRDVSAYQAAGNVTFVADEPGLADPHRLSAALTEAYGFDAPTFVRSVAEIVAVVTARPFDEEELAATAGRVQVTFLSHAPAPDTVEAMAEVVPADDRVVVQGREWFWLPLAGVSDSRLSVGEIEAMVGPMTMRTLGTVSRMWDRFGDQT